MAVFSQAWRTGLNCAPLTAHSSSRACVLCALPCACAARPILWLQARHPLLYAPVESLTLAQVRQLAGSYKEVVLKYEALSLVSGGASGGEGDCCGYPERGLFGSLGVGGGALSLVSGSLGRRGKAAFTG